CTIFKNKKMCLGEPRRKYPNRDGRLKFLYGSLTGLRRAGRARNKAFSQRALYRARLCHLLLPCVTSSFRSFEKWSEFFLALGRAKIQPACYGEPQPGRAKRWLGFRFGFRTSPRIGADRAHSLVDARERYGKGSSFSGLARDLYRAAEYLGEGLHDVQP